MSEQSIDLIKELELFLANVQMMRIAQIRYERIKTDQSANDKRFYEYQVDKALVDFRNEALIKIESFY